MRTYNWCTPWNDQPVGLHPWRSPKEWEKGYRRREMETSCDQGYPRQGSWINVTNTSAGYLTKVNGGRRSMDPSDEDQPIFHLPSLLDSHLARSHPGDCRPNHKEQSLRTLCRPASWITRNRTTTPPPGSKITSYGGGRSNTRWPCELRESLRCHRIPVGNVWADALEQRVTSPAHGSNARKGSTYTGHTLVVSHQRPIRSTLRKPTHVDFLWTSTIAFS